MPLKLPADQAGIGGLRKISSLISGGKLRRPLSGGGFASFKGQRLDFVITNDGRLVVGRGHSVLSNGESVRFAGELKFSQKGNLTEITNQSGHFRPPAGLGEKAKEFLRSLGIDVSGARVIDIPGS